MICNYFDLQGVLLSQGITSYLPPTYLLFRNVAGGPIVDLAWVWNRYSPVSEHASMYLILDKARSPSFYSSQGGRPAITTKVMQLPEWLADFSANLLNLGPPEKPEWTFDYYAKHIGDI